MTTWKDDKAIAEDRQIALSYRLDALRRIVADPEAPRVTRRSAEVALDRLDPPELSPEQLSAELSPEQLSAELSPELSPEQLSAELCEHLDAEDSRCLHCGELCGELSELS